MQQKIVCPGKVSALAVSPNGLYCVASIAEKIFVWEVSISIEHNQDSFSTRYLSNKLFSPLRIDLTCPFFLNSFFVVSINSYLSHTVGIETFVSFLLSHYIICFKFKAYSCCLHLDCFGSKTWLNTAMY